MTCSFRASSPTSLECFKLAIPLVFTDKSPLTHTSPRSHSITLHSETKEQAIVSKMSRKYVLTGVSGVIGSVAVDYTVEIAQPDQKLVFSSSNTSKLPPNKVAAWKNKGVELVEAS